MSTIKTIYHEYCRHLPQNPIPSRRTCPPQSHRCQCHFRLLLHFPTPATSNSPARAKPKAASITSHCRSTPSSSPDSWRSLNVITPIRNITHATSAWNWLGAPGAMRRMLSRPVDRGFGEIVIGGGWEVGEGIYRFFKLGFIAFGELAWVVAWREGSDGREELGTVLVRLLLHLFEYIFSQLMRYFFDHKVVLSAGYKENPIDILYLQCGGTRNGYSKRIVSARDSSQAPTRPTISPTNGSRLPLKSLRFIPVLQTSAAEEE